MAMKPTMVQLPEELIEQLDQRARRDGVSRSSVIREAVSHHLVADSAAAIERAYAQGYDRIPVGTPDEWGDVERFHQELEDGRPNFDERA